MEFLLSLLHRVDLVIQPLQVFLVVPLDLYLGRVAGDDGVVFVEGAAIETVDTEQFPFIFTVEGDEIEMLEALLREPVIIASAIEIQRCVYIFLLGRKVVNVF